MALKDPVQLKKVELLDDIPNLAREHLEKRHSQKTEGSNFKAKKATVQELNVLGYFQQA